MQRFKFRHGVRDITRYYDVCPRCRSVDALSTEGDGMSVRCSRCGYELTMDSCGFFHGEGGLVRTCPDWEALQLETYHALFERGEFFREDGVELLSIGEGFEQAPVCTGELVSSAEGLSIGGVLYPFRDMTPPEILSGGRKLEFTCAGSSSTCWQRNRPASTNTSSSTTGP